MWEFGGNRQAFLTDPLQVNSHLGDWDDKKRTLLGLEKGQAMTPAASAAGALGWLQFKGWHHVGGNSNYLGDPAALANYNGRTDRVQGLPNVTFRDFYAAKIMQLARDAADRARR